jgi:hypothetical protein
MCNFYNLFVCFICFLFTYRYFILILCVFLRLDWRRPMVCWWHGLAEATKDIVTVHAYRASQ